MLLIAALFTALSVCSLIMFKKVSHRPAETIRLLALGIRFTDEPGQCRTAADPFRLSFLQVHALYRTTGASFEKAQQEFATGVMSNKTVQTAAANAAANAASNATRGAFRP